MRFKGTCTSYSTGECTEFATKRMSGKVGILLLIFAAVKDRLEKDFQGFFNCRQRDLTSGKGNWLRTQKENSSLGGLPRGHWTGHWRI